MRFKLLGTLTGVLLASSSAFAQQVTTKAPFTVTIGGSVRSDFGFMQDDTANVQDREARIDYRLHLKAEAKAENGLVYGFDARLRNNQNSAGQTNQDVVGADRKFVYLRGDSWGQVQLGDNVGVATQLETATPNVGIGQGDVVGFANFGTYSFFYFDRDTYATRLSYLTPRFAGFQAGVTYTPEYRDTGRGNRRGNSDVTGGNYKDEVEFALTTQQKFGAFGVQATAAYLTGKEKIATRGDFSVLSLGTVVSYEVAPGQTIAVGGNYFDNGETNKVKTARGTPETTGWNVGVSYTVASAWAVAANYTENVTETPGARDQTDKVFGVGGAYQLAPGLSLQADAAFFDIETASGLKAGKTSNEGTQFTLRTRLDF